VNFHCFDFRDLVTAIAKDVDACGAELSNEVYEFAARFGPALRVEIDALKMIGHERNGKMATNLSRSCGLRFPSGTTFFRCPQ
jgi:hypothetical protein